MNVLNVPAKLLLLSLPILMLASCQTPVTVDTSQSEQLIVETVTIIDDAACEALLPSALGTVDEEGNFNEVRITQKQWLELPEYVRTKIVRDDTAHESYCND